MNARTIFQYPEIGAAIHGGFFHGVALIDGKLWGEVTGPKADCQVNDIVWHPEHIDVPGAIHNFDSVANTLAMAAAGSPLALAAQACRSGGFDDWAVPAPGSQLQQWDMRAALPAGEAFEKKWHWSSKQFSALNAFYQLFDYGFALITIKSWQGGCARFVRRFLIE